MEKRAAILQAASHLFLARGLQNTSMDAVAAAAGVSKQTVYSHFSGKDELFQTVIVSKVESYSFVTERLPKDIGLRKGLLLLGRRFLNLMFDAEVVAMHRVVIGESVVHPKIAELFYEAGPGTALGTIETFLHSEMGRGRLAIEDPGYASSQFLNMIRGHYQMLLLMNMNPRLSEQEAEAHVARVVEQFLMLYEV